MSNLAPLVTIVTPVYNQRIDYLNDTTKSVLGQTDTRWQWLIADNHSSADVASWLSEREADPRIRVLRQPENLGVFPNLNAALAQVDSPFALGLCSDDRLAPDAVARFLGMMERFPEADLVLASFGGLDELGRSAASSQPAHRRAMTKMTRILPRHEALEFVLRFGSFNGNLTGMFFRRTLLERIGYFHTELPQAADWEWVYRAAKEGSILLSIDHVAEVRTHGGQLSNANHKSGEAARDVATLLRKFMSDPELRDHPRAGRWARHHMQFQAWQATRAFLQGDFALAARIAAEIDATTGLFATFGQMVMNMPLRLEARWRKEPQMPPR